MFLPENDTSWNIHTNEQGLSRSLHQTFNSLIKKFSSIHSAEGIGIVFRMSEKIKIINLITAISRYNEFLIIDLQLQNSKTPQSAIMI